MISYKEDRLFLLQLLTEAGIDGFSLNNYISDIAYSLSRGYTEKHANDCPSLQYCIVQINAGNFSFVMERFESILKDLEVEDIIEFFDCNKVRLSTNEFARRILTFIETSDSLNLEEKIQQIKLYLEGYEIKNYLSSNETK